MSTSIDPDAVSIETPRHRGEYGPSDTSDSASDVIGTYEEATDSDAGGTGERASVEVISPNDEPLDITPDHIVTPLKPAEEFETLLK